MKKTHWILGLVIMMGCHQAPLRAVSDVRRQVTEGVLYFEFGKWVVPPSQKRLLAEKANLLRGDRNISVVLEGHTDPVGSEEFNLHLGDRRARKVKAELVKEGVEPDRLAVMSYGESRRTTQGQSCRDFDRDRRVELRVR